MGMARFRALLGVALLFLLGGPRSAAGGVGVQLVAEALSPTYLWHAEDDRLFVLERAGRILIYKPGQGLLPTPFLDLSAKVQVEGERGLFAIAFHPDFATNGLFYVSYYGGQPVTGVILARYRVSSTDPDVADPASEVIVFTVAKPSGQHNGGQIAIRQGHLYLSLGDGGGSNDPPCNAQDGGTHLGKMVRLDIMQNLDAPPYYAVPSDNPFVGAADPGDEFLDEIWVLGLRNPWRFSFDTLTGDLFIGDVGQDSREETDYQPATSPGGENYGWKVMEGTHCKNATAANCAPDTPPCFDPAYTPPIHEVPHSENGTCAGVGGFRYRGGAIPELTGKYVFGDFCSGRIWSVEEFAPGVWGNRQLLVDGERWLKSFGQDQDGELYALSGDRVLKLVPASTVEDPPSPGQQVCIEAMNRRGAEVLGARGRLDAECIRRAGMKRLPAGQQSADACLGADSRGRMERRVDLIVAEESARCRVDGRPELVPAFGYTSAGRVASAAEATANRFTRALFGAAVDDAVILAAPDPGGARCQSAVVRRAHTLLGTLWKVALDGKKAHLDGRLGEPVVSGVELGDRVLQYMSDNTGIGRVAARRRALEGILERSCRGLSLGQTFPGDCAAAGASAGFADCMVERARCQLCRSFEAFDGLTLDCDVFDDGADDDSCASEVDALCAQPGSGVNLDAAGVDCPRLQDYRLFVDSADPRQGPDGGIPFDLTTPLFSDYAQKYRFLFLPPGTQAMYDGSRPFTLPVGTIIAKTFAFAHDLRDLSLGDDLIETRLLIHREPGWEGLAYIWDAGTQEAHLSNAGDDVPVTWTHFDGSTRSTTYHVPTPTECGDCHMSAEVAGDAPIGPKARLLNRNLDYGSGPENQLDHLTAIAALAGAPPSGSAPRLPVWNDPLDGTLAERTFAYLESNCAHCHNPDGRAGFTGLDLRHDTPVGERRGVCQPSGYGGIPLLTYNVVPGEPDDSILFLRLGSASDGVEMPPLLKSVVHQEGVALVQTWIDGLTGTCP